MTDCRIFVLLKLLSSDVKEARGAHLFPCVCVCVTLTRRLPHRDKSFSNKNTPRGNLLEEEERCWVTCHADTVIRITVHEYPHDCIKVYTWP